MGWYWFNKAKISVNRSVGNYAKYGLIIKEPKTEKSLRTITVYINRNPKRI